jgi:hypothetical protein
MERVLYYWMGVLGAPEPVGIIWRREKSIGPERSGTG